MANIFGGTSDERQWQSPDHGVIMDRHKTVIGVKGIGSGSGATFTAMNLAFELAQQTGSAEGVTFAEGKRAEAGRCSAEDILKTDPVYRRISAKGRTNLYKNVNWIFGADDLRALPGRFVVVDSPMSFDAPDIIVAVVDPLPSRIEAGLETFKRLREQQGPVIWILNKANRQAGIREVERYLKQKFDYRLELLPEEVFYKAEFSCTQQFFIHKPQTIEKVVCDILEHNK